jgi:hypothetical protein
MKTILVILFVIPIIGFCQDVQVKYDNDYVLQGTTVLRWSSKYRQTLYKYGYYLDELNASACDNGGKREEELKDTILIAVQSDSTIAISISKVANCSDAFLGEIEIVNDSIINLVTHEYGGRSICSCCFGLDFIIKTEGIHKQIRYTMIDGDRNTLTEIKNLP